MKGGRTVARLAEHGLTVLSSDGTFADLAIVDERSGLTAPRNWLTLATAELEGWPRSIECCYLSARDESASVVAMPSNWRNDRPRLDFTLNERAEQELVFISREGEIDLYIDLSTMRPVYTAALYGDKAQRKRPKPL